MAKKIGGNNNAWVRTFEVSEPTRHRKGFTVYKITSTVFPKSFPESATKITVWKRYSDFKKLHKDLESIFKQLYLKGEFPVFPKAKVFGRFEFEVVEERRKAALHLLEFTASHTQLFTSKAFINFFEIGYSTQDFLGQILFSKGDSISEPPTAVVQENVDVDTPCLEPERVWKATAAEEDDGVSLSTASISSSLSPDNPEIPSTAVDGKDSKRVSTTYSDRGRCGDGASETSVINSNSSQTHLDDKIPVNRSEANSCKSEQSSHTYLSTPASPSPFTASETNWSSEYKGNGIIRSATVTDDLSSYFDEEFEDAAFLFPTGSCSSLDALPGFNSTTKTTALDEDKSHAGSSRGLFSLPRKKSKGFGLFDFLPLFPKKSKKKPVEEENKEKEMRSSLSVGYICEAAGHFAVAQFHESNMDYEDAFTAYKEGIRVLLAGAQDDTDRNRKVLAKNNLEKYISRAETLKVTYLSERVSNSSRALSPVFSSPNKQQQCLAVLNRSEKRTLMNKNKDRLLSSDMEELKSYKVVGLGPGKSKILVVMNPQEASPRCYVAKVLWKSPCTVYPEKPTLVPVCVPFMVKLQKWFDTPDKIVLLLEHAGGGRLIDFVTNYQYRLHSTPTPNGQTSNDLTPEAVFKSLACKFVHELCNGDRSFILQIVGPQATCCNERSASEVEIQDDSSYSLVADSLNIKTESDDSNEPHSESLEPQCNEVPVVSNIPSRRDASHDVQENSENVALSFEVENSMSLDAEVDLSRKNLDVAELLENSKALLQTVCKTLEYSVSEPTASVQKLSGVNNGNGPSTLSQLCEEKVADNCNSSLQINEPIPRYSVEQCSESSPISKFESPSPCDMIQSLTPVRMVPENCIKMWAAEIVIALEALHSAGLIYGNLHVNDVLFGENGHVLLSYKSLWSQVDDSINANPCVAPEVQDAIGIAMWKNHPSADWWSVGAILFLLLIGESFHTAHPEGVFPDMVIKIPESSASGNPISRSAQTLLSELLQCTPSVRLGYYGAAEIKSHPFFDGIDWDKMVEESNNL